MAEMDGLARSWSPVVRRWSAARFRGCDTGLACRRSCRKAFGSGMSSVVVMADRPVTLGLLRSLHPSSS